jgi:hypothetical protein
VSVRKMIVDQMNITKLRLRLSRYFRAANREDQSVNG